MLLPVNVNAAVFDLDRLPGKGGHPLDQIVCVFISGRLEYNDIPPLRLDRIVDETVHQHHIPVFQDGTHGISRVADPLSVEQHQRIRQKAGSSDLQQKKK